MNSGLLDGGEDTGALNDVLSSGAGPVDVGGVLLVEDDDLSAVDEQEGAIVLNLTCREQKIFKLFVFLRKTYTVLFILSYTKSYSYKIYLILFLIVMS